MGIAEGHQGSVVYASGFTTNAHAWNIRDGGVVNTVPVFGTAHMLRSMGVGNWEGDYRCQQNVTVNTALTMGSGYYTSNVHQFSITVTKEDLLTTAFGASYNTRIMGLEDATGSYDCWIDDTTAFPDRGDADTITITLDTGITYSLNVLITETNPRISTDGSDRHITVNWEGNGALTETSVPLIGSTGAAEFIADGGRKYTGTIFVTQVSIDMTAQMEAAEWTMSFVGSGAPTPS